MLLNENKERELIMNKLFQNGKGMLRWGFEYWLGGEFEKKGYWYAEHNLSYSVYEMNKMKFEVTNEGHGCYKWQVKGINNPYSGQASTKSGVLDIIKQVSKY